MFASKAQDQSVLASAGDYNKNSSFSLEWTLGEFAVETISSSAKMYTQGFNQSFIIIASTKPVAENNIVYNISVAPNPILSILNFNINSKNNIKVFVTVADVRGVIFMQKTASSSSDNLQLDFKGLPAGTYTLTVRDGVNAHIIKTYQLIRL
jgi:hypothetical protein